MWATPTATFWTVAAILITAVSAVGAPEIAVATAVLALLLILLAARDRGRDRAALGRLAARLDYLERFGPPLPQPLATTSTTDGDEPVRLGDRMAGQLVACVNLAEAARGEMVAALAALPHPLVVVDGQGLIALANASGLALLGPGAEIGTSIYDVIGRADLEALRASAEGLVVPMVAGGSRRLLARQAGGDRWVLTLPAADPAPPPIPDAAPRLFGMPPIADAPITADTPLDRLPVWVLDCETTGLDPRRDRVLSIGAVRLHGRRMFRHVTIDRLVDPGVPVPATSRAIHGISADMLRGKPAFADLWPELAAAFAGCALVGHNIGFDLACLAAEVDRAGGAWVDPPSLCTRLAIGGLALMPDDADLEVVAGRFGIHATGRHTALGDALVTAEVWQALLQRGFERGVTTYGALRDLSLDPRNPLVAAHRRAGWRT
jgi:DNA polymerase-3 subunit epsilon